MLSLRSAVDILSGSGLPDRLEAIARVAGLASEALPLDAATRVTLGLSAGVHRARIAAGAGTLRALLVEYDNDVSLRDSLPILARHLAARAPNVLWLLVAECVGGGDLAIAAWPAGASRPRLASLLVDRARVALSDAETLSALAAASGGEDLTTHARWLEVLGRDALTRRFYRALERVVALLASSARGRASPENRAEIALLHVSRLLFLSFLESKGWLNGDRGFLERGFADCMAARGKYHRRVLDPLFFGTLNTRPSARAARARAFGRVPFLNGGLFARSPSERRERALEFTDEGFGAVFDELLTRYRFTACEETTTWSDAAVDPEMLGKAFESLMASRERRVSGAFYTPHVLVERVTRAALGHALSGAGVTREQVDAVLNGEASPGSTSPGSTSPYPSPSFSPSPSPSASSFSSPSAFPDADVAALLRRRVADVRVLDPACGSGAFLVHVLETLAALTARLGDKRPPGAIRRHILTRAIFGVDVNPTAVWLCELRLWLSVAIESEESDPLTVAPLPNLDRHILAGDAIAGSVFSPDGPVRGTASLALLRERYARASGARKRTLERELGRRERAHVLVVLDAELGRCAARRRDLFAVLRGRDLFGTRREPDAAECSALRAERERARELRAKRRRMAEGGALPFAWSTHCPEAAARGGFDVVLGNPPWVRLHRIPTATRAALRARFSVFSGARWERGATAGGAGSGFASQVDLAALFVERSLALLRAGGALALLLPVKLWHSLAGGGARRLLAREEILLVEDWSEAHAVFDAVVYPSLVVARRRFSGPSVASATTVTVALHHRDHMVTWDITPSRLGVDADSSSPWLLVPPEVRAAWDRLARAGPALAASALGRPLLGVKSGCNEAFVVTLLDSEASELSRVRSGESTGTVETRLLRPVLRGETVAAWRATSSAARLVWTHGESGIALERLPPHAERWLGNWRDRLRSRADSRGGRWWSLFRTASASARTARVVWADVGRVPRALVLEAGDATVALNSCYVLPCSEADDALALAAILNSPLAAAWLNVLAEPARGGYRRYLGWTVALFPLPADWARARSVLLPLALRAAEGETVDRDALLAAALRAYRVRRTDMAPLLAWRAW